MKRLARTICKQILPLFIVFCATFSSLAWADPRISGIEGIFSNGNSITIRGIDFGDNGPDVAIFDDFEGGTNGGDILINNNCVAQIGTWTEKGDDATTPGTMFYSNAHSNSGSLSYVALAGNDGVTTYNGGNCQIGTTIPNPSNYIFLSYWVYLPEEDQWPGAGSPLGINWKQTWLFYSSSIRCNDLCQTIAGGTDYDSRGITITGNYSGADGNNQGSAGSMTKGHWHRVSIFLKGEYDSTGRCVAYCINRQGIDSLTKTCDVTRSTMDYPEQTTYSLWHVGAYARTTPNSVSHLTFDDVYLASGSDCRARVEIGDANTYTNCTNMAITTPASWQNNQITAIIRSGSFRLGDSAYLFVVDADGNVSNGYPITIGGGGTADTDPPGDVANFEAEAEDSQVALSWTNPIDGDFAGTMIRYRTDGTYPTSHTDGILVCNAPATPGSTDNFVHAGLTNDTTYYYSAFTYDEVLNYTSTVHVSATPTTGEPQSPPGVPPELHFVQ